MAIKPTYEELEQRVKELENGAFDRKQAEEALRASALSWDTTFDAITDSVSLIDVEGKILQCNKATANFIGKPINEIVGNTCWELVHGTLEPIEGCPIVRMRETLRPESLELAVDDRVLNVATSPIFDQDGNVAKAVHTITDITDRKQAEEALRESETRYRDLFDNSPTSLWEEDFSKVKEFLDDLRLSGVSNLRAYLGEHPDKTAHCAKMVDILDVNKASMELFEAESNNEILGNLDKLFIDESLEVFREELITLYERKGPFRGEIIGKSLRGNLIDCVVEVSIAPGYEDLWSKVLVSVTDITDRKVAEEELRENEERFRTVADFTYDWEYWLAPDGQFIYVSPSCERITGYSPEEFMTDPGLFKKIVHPDDDSIVVNHLGEEQGLEELFPIDFRIITRSGEERWINHNCQPVYGVDGTYLGRRGGNRDITKRKQMEEELLKVKKFESLGVLAGGIAHQFNNALSSITGHTGLLEMEYPEDEKIMDYAKAMKQSAHRMAGLTSQLLAYARGGKYNPQTMSLSNFVEGTLPIIQHTLDPDIRLETDLPQDVMNVEVDRTQMQMVLSAIVANSNEAIDPPGRIRISTRNMDLDKEFTKDHPGLKPGPYVCLSIEDDGKGMDEETKNRIFDPFFTTHFIGRGLGMASVYGIVTNHDGSISVDSEPGKGTAVTIYLPALEAKEEVEGEVEERIVPAPAIDLPTGEGTVLVIEDEEPLVELFRQILERLGYRVLQARTGEEAVEIAKKFDGRIDLALLDIKLPDMSGTQVYPLIMEARPNLKVIVCSGYSIDGPAQPILDAGAEGFIQKPFLVLTLAEKLKEVLEGK